MAYLIDDHPLLSPAAKRLDPEESEAQQRVAERVLGLRDTDYTGSAKQDAEDALAMQVSLQVATDPDTYLASSITRGSRSITYRDGIPIHPLALEIATQLFGEDLGTGITPPRQSASVPVDFRF